MNEIESTAPINKPEDGILGRTKSLVRYDELECRPFYLSDTEILVCEVIAKTGEVKEAVKAVYDRYKRNIGIETIKRWIRTRPMVKAEITRLLRMKGIDMSEEEWKANVSDIARNDKKVERTTPAMYKLLSDVNGWGKEVASNQFIGKDITVNILQKNGRS